MGIGRITRAPPYPFGRAGAGEGRKSNCNVAFRAIGLQPSGTLLSARSGRTSIAAIGRRPGNAQSCVAPATGRERWRWTQTGILQPSHGPNGRVADSLDEAKAAFRAAWERGP